jgi:hypothetical protein
MADTPGANPIKDMLLLSEVGSIGSNSITCAFGSIRTDNNEIRIRRLLIKK